MDTDTDCSVANSESPENITGMSSFTSCSSTEFLGCYTDSTSFSETSSLGTMGYSPTACNRRDYDDEGVFVGCTSNGTEGEVTPRNAKASGGNNTGGGSCPSFTSDIGCMPTTDGVARYVSCK